MLATVSDAKLPEAKVLSFSDYYAFGSAMPGRSGGAGYRYGFNGKENDGETGWQDYGMRMYNPKLSRFFTVDPITARYPELTPYQFASNTPVQAIDLDGLEAIGFDIAQRIKDAEALSKVNGKSMRKNYENQRPHGEGLINVTALTKDVFGDKDPITEKDLSERELNALTEIVSRKMQHKNPNERQVIKYDDYETTTGGDPYADVASNKYNKSAESGKEFVIKQLTDPRYRLKSTLGQASIVREGDRIFVVDRFNFNDAIPESERQKLEEVSGPLPWLNMRQTFMLHELYQSGGHPYKALRALGTWYGSPEGSGPEIKIEIILPRETGEEKEEKK